MNSECGDRSGAKLTHTRNISHPAAKCLKLGEKTDANSSWDTNAVLNTDYKNSESVLMTISRAMAALTTPARKH